MPGDQSKTILIVVAVCVLVLGVVLGGLALRIAGTGSDVQATEPVSEVADTFPVPPDTPTALPPATGATPPSATRSWHVTGTLDEACTQWRELFRSWVDPTQSASVGGEVIPGISCSFTAIQQGFDAELRVASYAGAQPTATLTVAER